MKVLERWKHFAGDPAFAALFDPETAALSERIFGAIPGTEALSGARAGSAA